MSKHDSIALTTENIATYSIFCRNPPKMKCHLQSSTFCSKHRIWCNVVSCFLHGVNALIGTCFYCCCMYQTHFGANTKVSTAAIKVLLLTISIVLMVSTLRYKKTHNYGTNWVHDLVPPMFTNLCLICIKNSLQNDGVEILSASLAPILLTNGQWCGALMIPLLLAWTRIWTNNRFTGDMRRHDAHEATL